MDTWILLFLFYGYYAIKCPIRTDRLQFDLCAVVDSPNNRMQAIAVDSMISGCA